MALFILHELDFQLPISSRVVFGERENVIHLRYQKDLIHGLNLLVLILLLPIALLLPASRHPVSIARNTVRTFELKSINPVIDNMFGLLGLGRV